MASTRAPASVLAFSSLLTLTLACATGSSEGEETTFASFGSGNDDVDDDTSDTATDATSGTDTGMDADTSTSDDPSGETTSTSETTSGETTSDTSSSDDVPPDPCGDGSIDPGEECDGVDLGGLTCVDQGFDMGQLGCNDDCTFDTSACELIEEFCGDGIVNNGEQCEPGMLGNATCASSGFVFGTLGCNAQTCVFDTSGCQNVWIGAPGVGSVPGVAGAGPDGRGAVVNNFTNENVHAYVWLSSIGLLEDAALGGAGRLDLGGKVELSCPYVVFMPAWLSCDLMHG